MSMFFQRFALFRLLPLSLILILLAASPARAEFMGGGYLTDADGCRSYGWPLNTEMVRARLNARQIDGGTSELVLSFAVGGANTYRFRADVAASRTWHRVDGSVIWGRLYQLGSRTQIRILSTDLSPYAGTSIDQHTRQFRLRARIRNFNGMQGCSVTAVLMLNYWNRPAD